MRIVAVVAGDDDDDVDCSDQSRSCSFTTLSRGGGIMMTRHTVAQSENRSQVQTAATTYLPRKIRTVLCRSLSRFIPNISREAIRSLGQLSTDAMRDE